MASSGRTVSPLSAMNSVSVASPRTGSSAAPVILGSSPLPPRIEGRPPLFLGQLSSSSLNNTVSNGQASASLHNHHSTNAGRDSPPPPVAAARRRRSHSGEQTMISSPGRSAAASRRAGRKSLNDASTALAKARSRSALKANDAMVYLDGPQVYTCAQCRTHLTSHDEIISKSFHGRHGRAYLFDHCVNVTIGPPEDRLLITGLHSVCDIFCKRCKNLVGWTYARAYEASQKYKEGKFIIEKINLHLEESDYYDIAPPAGERKDRFRARSMSWGSECPLTHPTRQDIIYEYRPTSPSNIPRDRQGSFGKSESPVSRRPVTGSIPPPPPPALT